MDKVLKGVQSLMKAARTASDSPLAFIKTVYFGDPKVIPECNLPAITISPSSTDFERRGSRYDQKTHSIDIKIVLNQKDLYRTNTADIETVTAIQEVILAMEGVGDDHETLENTVCGVIQTHPCLEFNDGGSMVSPANDSKVESVSYGEGSRAFPTYEATATISVSVVGDR